MAAPSPGVPPEPGDPQGRSGVYPADGGGCSSTLELALGHFHSWPDLGMRTMPGRWLWLLGAFPLARGVSRARLIAKRMAGQVNAAVSCSSLAARVCFPLFGSLLALTCLRQLRRLRLRGVNALPGHLIKRREDVFQKSLASSSAWSVLLSWCRGQEASTAFS